MMELESMAVEMPEVKGHPNRAAFRGVLTVVDVASQRAPSGAKGRRVILTRKAAEEALPSLIGMALDYAPSYDRHDVRRKVGIITSAEMVGRDLEVGGYLYAKDFPEVVDEIARSGRRISGERLQASGFVSGTSHNEDGSDVSKIKIARVGKTGQEAGDERSAIRAELAEAVEHLREMTAGIRRGHFPRSEAAKEISGSAKSELGMSFEVADAITADERSRILTLLKVTFTGAAILRRDRAAYENTWIALTPKL